MTRLRSLRSASIQSRLIVIDAGTQQMGASISEIAQNTASLARIAGEAVEIAATLELVDEASRATRAELQGIRAAAHDLAATSQRLQDTVG